MVVNPDLWANGADASSPPRQPTVRMISENASNRWLYPSLYGVQNSSADRPSPRSGCVDVGGVRVLGAARQHAQSAIDIIGAGRASKWEAGRLLALAFY